MHVIVVSLEEGTGLNRRCK